MNGPYIASWVHVLFWDDIQLFENRVRIFRLQYLPISGGEKVNPFLLVSLSIISVSKNINQTQNELFTPLVNAQKDLKPAEDKPIRQTMALF